MSLYLLAVVGLTDCQPHAEPKQLPALDLVLDFTALADSLKTMATMAPGLVTISIRWSDHPEGYLLGALPHLPGHEVVLGHVLASLRPAPKDGSLAVQVHVQTGAQPAARLERSVLCGPEAVEGQNVSPAFGVGRVTTFAPSPIPGVRPEPVRTKMLVSVSGAVTAVTILSSSGFPEIDRDAVVRAKAQHYRPALLDGRPVAVWVSEGVIHLAR